MSLGKKDISYIISSKAQISLKNSNALLDKFIKIVKSQSFSKNLKISNFGTFKKIITPQRIGRNPITKEEHLIPERVKIVFKPSNFIKNNIN